MDSLEQPLNIDDSKLDIYKKYRETDVNLLPEEHRLAYELAIISLTSKQGNEPYELLLSYILNLERNDKKHGWDGFDNKEEPLHLYEFKPSKTNTFNINDDTIKKINEYENIKENQRAWVVLASITPNYSFNKIYKFPAEIYTEDRKKRLQEIQLKTPPPRSVYSISIKKSLEFCKKFNKKYFVWRR